jgi:hypothetical protein
MTNNKQETLEEAAKNHINNRDKYNRILCGHSFKEGAKWQAERMYSEEEVLELLHQRMIYTLGSDYQKTTTSEWFKQFKKQKI